jgi:acyl dehydratase
MHLDAVTSRSFADVEVAYEAKDTILYALGVGFGAQPLDQGHLRFLYEDGLVAAPTFANVLGHPGFWAREADYDIDWKKLLHAEQRLTMHAQLPPNGRIIGQTDIMGVRDRGAAAGAMLFQRKRVRDTVSGVPIASVITTLMLRGDGGCGDYGDAPAELAKLPEGDPDYSVAITTEEIMPLIYRLSGDLNPLHIDPAIAKAAGFPRPILHGLASMGLAGYVILREFCELDPSALKSLALRFSRPVFPGDTINFDFWKTDPVTLRFRASVQSRDVIVLDRGLAELK